MAGPGRKPFPEHIRLLKNDVAHRHRYVGVNNPEPSSSKAVAPESLSPRAKVIFDEIVAEIEEMYPCSETDSRSLVLYANNHEQLEFLELYLRENGVTYEQVSMHGSTWRKRPEVDMHKQCKDFELRILVEFGLTPSSRCKVKNVPKDAGKKKNSFADLEETG